MGRIIRGIAAAATAVVSASCATTGGLKHAEGHGETGYYRIDRDSLYDAAVIALADLGLRIVELQASSGYVAAEAAGGLTSYGEVIGVFVRAGTRDSTASAVEVVSRRRLATNVLAKSWEADVFRKIEAQLPPESMLLASHGPTSPPRISGDELHSCREEASRTPVTPAEMKTCRAEGGADGIAVMTCLERNRPQRLEAGVRSVVDAFNDCLRTKRKDP